MLTAIRKYASLLYIFLWLILTLFLFTGTAFNLSATLFAVSAFLIYTHILYAGYFIITRSGIFNPFTAILGILIYACLFLLTQSTVYPVYWFYWLQIIFSYAVILHLYVKARVKDAYLHEFCNYKIYIELLGAVLSLFGILLYSLFPQIKVILGVVTLIVIIKLNFNIFIRKKLYSIYYQNEPISIEPFVSIVIIAYNEERYIGRLLSSIKAQCYPKYEVIIVDDHSTDNTLEVAGKFASSMPLKVVQKDVRGASRSRNYGASFALGEVILFLDADVTLPPRFIAANLNAFREQRLFVAGVDFIAETENKIDKLIVTFYRLWLKTVQYFNPRGIGFCLFVQKELHKKVLFDETVVMSEDFDYVNRAYRHGKFRIITKMPLQVSWRRFRKENRFLLMLKYLFFEWHRQNIGEIRRKILPYEFGNNKRK